MSFLRRDTQYVSPSALPLLAMAASQRRSSPVTDQLNSALDKGTSTTARKRVCVHFGNAPRPKERQRQSDKRRASHQYPNVPIAYCTAPHHVYPPITRISSPRQPRPSIYDPIYQENDMAINNGYSTASSSRHASHKLAHPLPTASTFAAVEIGHVQLRDLVQCTGPRGRIAYATDNAIKEVDVRRGVNSTRTLVSLDFEPFCLALSSSGELVVAGGPSAELQFTTVAPPPHPSLTRRGSRATGNGPPKGSSEDDESDEGVVDESMGWSMDGSAATRTRHVRLRGAGDRMLTSFNNHVMVLGDNDLDGGIYGQGKRVPEQTRIVVSNNDECIRVLDVDTRESASSKDWGSTKVVGSVKLGTAANQTSISPDGRTMLAVGDDTRLQIFNVNARGTSVDFERVSSYTSGSDHNFTSAWSSSGLQFASGSQDGTVTVWDVRSSRPLATWSVPRRSGFRHPSGSTFTWPKHPGNSIRSLKFSPAGGNREMLVFTEHTEHVHIVDAQSFSEHQILDVPSTIRVDAASSMRESVGSNMPTNGGDSPSEREVDLTGVTFDRTGRWMYVGTERCVIEYEMVSRRGRTYDAAEWA